LLSLFVAEVADLWLMGLFFLLLVICRSRTVTEGRLIRERGRVGFSTSGRGDVTKT
jgi:hypothetical protein